MIKNYISLILALTALLGSFQSVITFERLSSDYESKLSNNYSIIIVAKEEISLERVSSVVDGVSFLENINVDEVIGSIDNRLSAENIIELQEELPLFYRVKLDYLPSKYQLYSIEDRLRTIESVVKVEGFANVQNRISALFEIVSYILTTFTVLFFILSLIVTVKQTIIWRYAHSERLYIMSILGAKLWIRSKELYKMVTISSIISTIFISAIFSFSAFSRTVMEKLQIVGLEPIRYEIVTDSLILLVLSLLVSLVSLTAVVVKTEKINR